MNWKITAFLVCSLVLAAGPSIARDATPDEALAARLKQDFMDTPVVFVQQGIYTGEYSEEKMILTPSVWHFTLQYFHVVSPERVARDKKAWEKCCTSVDSQTFQQTFGAAKAAPLVPNERLKVVYIAVSKGDVRFVLQADQLAHGGAAATSSTGSDVSTAGGVTRTTTYKNQWGLAYEFVFDGEKAVTPGSYDSIVSEIRKVFVPAGDAKVTGAVATGTATKSLEIKNGMTRDQVIQGLGAPKQSVVAGSKELLKYPDFNVVIEDGKVVDVKF